MSTLFIRLPSHASAEALEPGTPLYCAYALVSERETLERDGVAALPEMGDLVRRARRVVLLLAASDVTLLRIKVPPLSGARLKAALPNLVEEHLMSDPAECVVVAGEIEQGLRTVAVVQRNWLEILHKSLSALGANRIAALPAQLCLPLGDVAAGQAVACVQEQGNDIELALRSAAQEGLGVAVLAEQPENAAFEVIQTLNALAPQRQVLLHVPPARLRDYESSLHLVPEQERRISLRADSWDYWIAGARIAAPDLMSGLAGTSGTRFDWRRWRLPLALASAVLLVNLVGLTVDWLRMQREAEALRAGMLQTYRTAFPDDTVIVDPLAQARQKAAAARQLGGEFATDDFLALAAGLAQAWAASGGRGAAPVASLDYRERTLVVRIKPGAGVEPERLQTALAARQLNVDEQGDGVWQIRSAR